MEQPSRRGASAGHQRTQTADRHSEQQPFIAQSLQSKCTSVRICVTIAMVSRTSPQQQLQTMVSNFAVRRESRRRSIAHSSSIVCDVTSLSLSLALIRAVRSTPSGGVNSRYKPRTGSASGVTGGTAARTLFPGAAGSKNPANWEEHAGGAGGENHPNGGGEGGDDSQGGGGGGTLLRGSGAHPEHWESYHDGQSSSSQAASGGASGSGSSLAPPSGSGDALALSPFDSPSLGPFRPASGSSASDLPADSLLQLDAKGTDVSLSTMLKSPNNSKDGGAAAGGHNEISIHMLSLLYDPPVQGCELKPYVSVVDSVGRVSAVQTDEAALNLDFRWFRGQKRVCSNSQAGCTKAANIQCISCSKMSPNLIPPHLTYFCSEQCLKDNWPQHKQLHMQQHLKQREPREWTVSAQPHKQAHARRTRTHTIHREYHGFSLDSMESRPLRTAHILISVSQRCSASLPI